MKNITVSLLMANSANALLAGSAGTSRYWDCSGGACGCGFNPNAPTLCHSNSLFDAPAGNVNGAKFYGTASISRTLGGDNWLGEGCGKCFKITGTSNIPSHKDETTVIVVKGTNFSSNSKTAHFDIAAPGF